jgi:hypothetical protein
MKNISFKSLLFISFIGVFLFSCQLGQGPKTAEKLPAGVHKGVVKEVLQTTNYTYLLMSDNDIDAWVALPKMEASKGETYYYMEGMEMNNFHSEELGRDFPTVYFIETVSKTPGHMMAAEELNYKQPSGAVKTEKQQVDIQPASGGVSIAEIFANKADYAGKTVKVRGEVAKFNSAIMSRNWMHLQDGTEHEGKFDLTVTTTEMVNVGDVVTVEGVIAIDQDFGYGYAYEVLLENAVIIKEM